MKPAIFVFVLAVLVAACSTQTPVATGQWMSISTRSFEGIPKANVLRAAEIVLRQPGHDSRTWAFAHSPDGFVAARSYAVYAVLAAENGVDTWQVTARSQGMGTVAEVLLSRQSSAVVGTLGPAIGGIGGMMAGAPVPVAGNGVSVQSPFAYGVFWDRVDYVLGRRAGWPSCAELKTREPPGDPAGPSIFGLCLLVGAEAPPPARLASP